MRTREITALIVLVALTQLACYNRHFISTPQLAKLEATVDQKESVAVIVDGCDEAKATSQREVPGVLVAQAEGETATDGAPAESGAAAGGESDKASVEGIDPETGCPTVRVNTASPLNVITQSGGVVRVTPFNFAVTDTQVVSPDYDLLLPIADVRGAEVQTFSGWKTTALITGALAVGVGLFVGIALGAEDERALGQQ